MQIVLFTPAGRETILRIADYKNAAGLQVKRFTDVLRKHVPAHKLADVDTKKLLVAILDRKKELQDLIESYRKFVIVCD